MLLNTTFSREGEVQMDRFIIFRIQLDRSSLCFAAQCQNKGSANRTEHSQLPREELRRFGRQLQEPGSESRSAGLGACQATGKLEDLHWQNFGAPSFVTDYRAICQMLASRRGIPFLHCLCANFCFKDLIFRICGQDLLKALQNLD